MKDAKDNWAEWVKSQKLNKKSPTLIRNKPPAPAIQPSTVQNKATINRVNSALQIVQVEFKDINHFYTIVNWLNSNVGKGDGSWSIEGRVLRHLKQHKPITRTIYAFVPTVDLSILQSLV